MTSLCSIAGAAGLSADRQVLWAIVHFSGAPTAHATRVLNSPSPIECSHKDPQCPNEYARQLGLVFRQGPTRVGSLSCAPPPHTHLL